MTTTGIIHPRGVVADMTALSELDAMIEDIAAAWDASQTPSDLRETFVAFVRDNKAHVERLRAQLLATVSWWIVKGEEAGHDRNALEQAALQETQFTIAAIARAMKARQGEPFSPARVAIVAYKIAEQIAKAEPVKADLDEVTALVDDLVTDIEAERDRLRDLIDEIADMGLGDVEMEHRDIIARCRSEQKRWNGEDE